MEVADRTETTEAAHRQGEAATKVEEADRTWAAEKTAFPNTMGSGRVLYHSIGLKMPRKAIMKNTLLF